MARSFLSQGIGLAVTAVVSVILTPILVHGLGAFYYGMWILVASVLDYYGLLDLGIRYTLQRYVGRYHGMSDRAALNETLTTAFLGMAGIGGLLCALSFAFAAVLPGFFGLAGASHSLFQELVILEGVSVGILFPARLLGAYLCGLQRFDLYNAGSISTAVLRAVLFVVVLRLGFGVLGIVEVTLGISVLTLGVNAALLRWADPAASLRWEFASRARLRELARFSVYVFLSSMGDQLRFYSDSIVIARFLTVALTTPFNVVTRLVEYFKLAFYPVTGPLTTTLSALDGQGRERDARDLFLRASKWTALVALLGGTLLALHGKAILRLWVGASFEPSYSLLVILVLAYIVTLGQLPSQTILYAKARHRALALWTLGEGVANLALSVYWAVHPAFPERVLGGGLPSGYYSLAGVALGTAIPMLVVRLSVQPWYVLRTLELSATNYLRDCLFRPALAYAPFLAVCLIARSPWMGASLLHLASTVAWQTALFVALAYVAASSASDRQIVREQFETALRLLRARSATAASGADAPRASTADESDDVRVTPYRNGRFPEL